MFVAAKVLCGLEVVQPRKMVKVGHEDTCADLLTCLMEKTPGGLNKYEHSSISAFMDVKESDESKIRLEPTDDMKNIIELGYKFFIFLVQMKSIQIDTKEEVQPTGAKRVNNKVKAQQEPSSVSIERVPAPLPAATVALSPAPMVDKGHNTASPAVIPPVPPTPAVVATPVAVDVAAEASGMETDDETLELLHFDCVCGRSVRLTSRRSHEKYCKAIRKQAKDLAAKVFKEVLKPMNGEQADVTSEPDAITPPPLLDTFHCDCGVSFPTAAKLDQHCESCESTVGTVFSCVCGKCFKNVKLHAIHKEGCTDCQRYSKITNFSEYVKKRFVCTCGEAFDQKSSLIAHEGTCAEQGEPIESKMCVCGLMIWQPWNLKLHMQTCPVLKSSSKSSTSLGGTKRKLDATSPSNVPRPANKRRAISDREIQALLDIPVSKSSLGDKSKKTPFKREVNDLNDEYSDAEEKKITRLSKRLETATSAPDMLEIDKFEKIKLRRAEMEKNSNSRTKALKPPKSSKPLEISNNSEENSKKKRQRNNTPTEDVFYEVDMILLHSGNTSRPRSLQFLVRWKGYDSSEDCWLPFSECQDLKAMDDYCKFHEELSSLLLNRDEAND